MDQPTRRLDQFPDDAEQGATRRMDAPAPAPPRGVGPSATCLKCGGQVIATELVGSQGKVQVKRLDVMFGIFGGTSPLAAYVCTHCGYTELYVNSLDILLQE